MAIDPKLVSIKTASELPSGIPTPEGEFLYYEDNTLKKAEMSDLYDRVESAYLGVITPSSTIPSTGSWYGNVLEAGTFNNVSPAITVTAADFDVENGTANNEVRIIISDGVATKDVRRVKGDEGTAKLPLYSAIKSADIVSGTQFIDDENGNVIYRVISDLLIGELPKDYIGSKVVDISVVDKLELLESGDKIKTDSILNDGDFIESEISIKNSTFSGEINPTNGIYTANVSRKASDFTNIEGYTHIYTNIKVVNSLVGTAFYADSNEGSFISGKVNQGDGSSFYFIEIPPGAKYVRYSGRSTDDGVAEVYKVNLIQLNENEIGLYKNNVLKKFEITKNAVSFQANGVEDNYIIYKEGEYTTNSLDIDTTSLPSGFVRYDTGTITATGVYSHTDYINISDFNTVRTNGKISGSMAGLSFYDADKVYISGFGGQSADLNEIFEYPIPENAVFLRDSFSASTVNKVLQLLYKFSLLPNKIAFIQDKKETIYSGGGDYVQISGNELIADLPKDDGSNIESGYAYIDITTNNVKVKP